MERQETVNSLRQRKDEIPTRSDLEGRASIESVSEAGLPIGWSVKEDAGGVPIEPIGIE